MTGISAVGREAAERLAELHAEAFDRPWATSEFEELLASPGVAALVAEEDGGTVGLIVLRAMVDEAEILTIAVSPRRRRSGLGRVLMEAGAATLAGAGVNLLWLEVAADNEAALALYGGAGFEVAGRRPAYYSRGLDVPAMDALVMRRDLNSGAG